MMNDKTYQPLPSGVTVADSGIAGQGLFATRRLVMGTLLGISHYRIDGEYIRTPLGGFLNHSDTPNCFKKEDEGYAKGFSKHLWLVTNKVIEEGEELTVKYTLYNLK